MRGGADGIGPAGIFSCLFVLFGGGIGMCKGVVAGGGG